MDLTLAGMSLIYTRKSSGPNTEPWGTPDVTGAGLYSLDKDLLARDGQEASDSGQDVSFDTVVAQFHSKTLVWDLVKRLAEVKQNGVDLLTVVEGGREVL